jgi:hypothetical protein
LYTSGEEDEQGLGAKRAKVRTARQLYEPPPNHEGREKENPKADRKEKE